MNTRRAEPLWLALRLWGLPFYVLEHTAGENVAKEGIAREDAAKGGATRTHVADDKAMPVVVLERNRVSHLNAQAQQCGVRVGMDGTTASVLSNCQALVRNPALESQILTQLAEALYAYTPYIRLHTTDSVPGMVLELSRCLKLFGGFEPLRVAIIRCVQKEGLDFAEGVAHTAEGAWLLSWEAGSQPTASEADATVCDREQFMTRLQEVPLSRLTAHTRAVEALHKTGFVSLGDVAKQVQQDGISSIKRRYGTAFAQMFCDIFAMDQRWGQLPLTVPAVASFTPKAQFIAEVDLEYPAAQVAALMPALEQLLQRLGHYLRKRQLQCQSLCWHLLDIYGNVDTVSVHSDQAQTQTDLLLTLTRIRLEHYTLPFEVDSLELHCPNPMPLQKRDGTLPLSGRHQGNPQSLAITTAKLKALLGEAAVFKVSYRDTHVPEDTNQCVPVAEQAEQTLPHCQRLALRPRWLFAAPKPIGERAEGLYWEGVLSVSAGPERIQTQWWAAPVARDYYVAQRDDGLRVWIFCDLHSQRWFVHGVFA